MVPGSREFEKAIYNWTLGSGLSFGVVLALGRNIYILHTQGSYCIESPCYLSDFG